MLAQYSRARSEKCELRICEARNHFKFPLESLMPQAPHNPQQVILQNLLQQGRGKAIFGNRIIQRKVHPIDRTNVASLGQALSKT